MTTFTGHLVLAGLSSAVLVAAGASGQPPVVQQQGPDASGPSIFELSFSNPGARSMGFGGAFVALADDATAAFANPAGLVQLVQAELALEARSWRFSTPYTESGRVSGRPTGIGIDVTSQIVEARSTQSTASLSYLSFVYPKKRWALALYRHQLADFENRMATQGLFADGAGRTTRFWDLVRTTGLEIVSHGVAGAWQLSEDLSVGLGLSYFAGKMLSEGGFFLTDDDSVASAFSESSYLPERRVASVPWSIDSTDWGLHGGLLWRLGEGWRIGGYYRQGPDFELGAEIHVGPAGAGLFGLPAGTVFATVATPVSFPDAFGLGGSFRSRNGNLTVSFEWDHIEHSDIVDSIDPAAFDDSVVVDDGELHLGAEYVLRDSRPILALRLGAWLDPDHKLHFPGEDPASRALFRSGGDEIHLAIGLGWVSGRFQIDFGMDFSDPVDTAAVSAVYSF